MLHTQKVQQSWIPWWCGEGTNEGHGVLLTWGAKHFRERPIPLQRRTDHDTTARDPIEPPPPRSGPAHTQHVGSISTAYGALRRRRDPQCLQQDSFGTTPAHPPQPHGSREPQRCIAGVMRQSKGSGDAIDMVANGLNDTARGFDIELHHRGSRFLVQEQRSPHRRHRFRYRIDGVVLADVRAHRRCYDARGRGVSDATVRVWWRGYGWVGEYMS
jgi:hypothetical protein